MSLKGGVFFSSFVIWHPPPLDKFRRNLSGSAEEIKKKERKKIN